MGLLALWSLAMLLGGLVLVVRGGARLLRPTPRLRRGRALAMTLVGILFVSMPWVYASATRPEPMMSINSGF